MIRRQIWLAHLTVHRSAFPSWCRRSNVRRVSSLRSPYPPLPWTVWWSPPIYASASPQCGSLWSGTKYHSPSKISTHLSFSAASHTLTGFLLKMKKASARCVKNLVNLCTSICSISSACLILMLMRTLLMLGSMRTRSFSFRATVRGFNNTSGDVWASISGTLCLSEVCDEKLDRQRAEVKEERTHCR